MEIISDIKVVMNTEEITHLLVRLVRRSLPNEVDPVPVLSLLLLVMITTVG